MSENLLLICISERYSFYPNYGILYSAINTIITKTKVIKQNLFFTLRCKKKAQNGGDYVSINR